VGQVGGLNEYSEEGERKYGDLTVKKENIFKRMSRRERNIPQENAHIIWSRKKFSLIM
jgi:hypothetical protein